MGFEGLKATFGQLKVESSVLNLTPFLFHMHALNPNSLRFIVTDFHTSTWESIRTVQHLEDMRDSIGIGGSWSEFVDYVIASLKSENVKLVLEGQSKSDGAKLIAQKSKGMPRICVSLTRLEGAASCEAIANFSLKLYEAFNSTHQLLIDEQERCSQLTKLIAAEQEKNGNIQYSEKQKLQKIDNDKAAAAAASSNSVAPTTLQDFPGKQSNQNMGSTKSSNRAVPAYRRARVRGVLLQDTEDDSNN